MSAPRLGLAALLVVSATVSAPAAAGPNQAGVAPPGGFVTACGAGLASANA